MIVAIYSGAIPSTTFVESLIIGMAEKIDWIYVFGKKNGRYLYKKSNIRIISTPRNKTILLVKIIYCLFLLRLKKPDDFRIFCRIFRNKLVKLKRRDLFRFLGELLPVINHKPDIFHIQWVKSGRKWLILKDFGIKVVVSFRGAHINYSPIVDEGIANEYIESFPKYDGFHSISVPISIEAQKYGAEVSKIRVIHPAVRVDLFNFKLRKKFKGGRVNLISIGRNHWVKGFIYAIDACRLLKDKGIDFSYTIVGANDSEELIYCINDLGLVNNIQLMPRLSQERVFELISSVDILLLPSVKEGFANVTLESMAIGTPVIRTNCGGMQNYVNHGVDGFLVPIRDPEGICKQIIELSRKDDVFIKDLILNARELIRNNYTIERQLEQMEKFYKMVVK